MPVLLFIILLTTALLFTNSLIFVPEFLLHSLHLPLWLSLGIFLAVFAWLIGD